MIIAPHAIVILTIRLIDAVPDIEWAHFAHPPSVVIRHIKRKTFNVQTWLQSMHVASSGTAHHRNTVMVRLSSIALATSLSATVFAGRAGNENYAQTRVLREAAKLHKRDGVQAIQATGLTFSIGEGDDAKLYISPSGPLHKSYTLSGAGSTSILPVTVINVDGDVSCDTLGDLVLQFQQNDDVWDEVSKFTSFRVNVHFADRFAGFHERGRPPDLQRLHIGVFGGILLDRSLANDVGIHHCQYNPGFDRIGSVISAGQPSMYTYKRLYETTLTWLFHIGSERAIHRIP